jgi:tRNA threonylcarbamoyladenosine modification (KEOPS) complex  Pcc1 subunit
LNKIGDFIFTMRFKIHDPALFDSIPRLLELEFKKIEESTSKIHDMEITHDDAGCVTIQAHANDLTSFKIAASSINKYIEIIGKVLELVDE